MRTGTVEPENAIILWQISADPEPSAVAGTAGPGLAWNRRIQAALASPSSGHSGGGAAIPEYAGDAGFPAAFGF